jgi:hypothetical protein
MWLDLVSQEFWWDGTCRSSRVPMEWYLRQPHESEVSDILWVGRRRTHYVPPMALVVTPLDRTSAHTCQWWDTDWCTGELAFLWCRSDIHLSLGRLEGTVITHFKLQGTVPLVGVALLVRLGSQDVCTDLSYFLFCLCTMSGPNITHLPNSDQLSSVWQGHP